jgi:hypothetical protein
VLRMLSRDFANVHLWDPFYDVCPIDICQAWIGERLVYRDDDHRSIEEVQFLTMNYVEFLRENVLTNQ